MKNKIKIQWISFLPAGVFLLFVGVFTVLSIVWPSREFSVQENRPLAQFPRPEADALLAGRFQQEYETYLSDQFVGRSFFTAVESDIWRALGRREINGVYLGDGGYLIEKYDRTDFDEALMDDNAWYLADFLDAMAERFGDEHVHALFVPSKGSVLRSRLPAFVSPYDSSFICQRVQTCLEDEYGRSPEAVVDLEETLRSSEEEYIYYRTDHHWTTRGAFYAYTKLCELCRQAPTVISDYTQTEVTDDFYGSSYDKVQLSVRPDSIARWEPLVGYGGITVDFNEGEELWDTFYYSRALEEKDKYAYFLGGNEAQVHIHTGAANGKALLLLKDSFANSFVEFLAKDYEDIYLIDLRYTGQSIYELLEAAERHTRLTDVLVMFNREKFMRDNNMGQLERTDGGGAYDAADPENGEDTEDEEGGDGDDVEDEDVFGADDGVEDEDVFGAGDDAEDEDVFGADDDAEDEDVFGADDDAEDEDVFGVDDDVEDEDVFGN